MWRHSVPLEVGGKEKKPARDFVPFTRSAKFIFSKRLSTSVSLRLSFSEFGACLAQNNMAQCKSSHSPEWKLKDLSKAICTKSPGLATEYCSKWRNDCQIFGFFGDEFHKENLHFRGWNCKVFISVDRNLRLFWSDLCLWRVLSMVET